MTTVCMPPQEGRPMVTEASAKDGITHPMIAATAPPPTQACTEVQPQAVMALKIAGICAPLPPKVSLAKRGNGTPYLVPICELS